MCSAFQWIQGAGSQQDIAKKLIAEQQEMPVEDSWRIIQSLGEVSRFRGLSLRYLGYKISHSRAEKIAKEVDNDSSGHISFQVPLEPFP